MTAAVYDGEYNVPNMTSQTTNMQSAAPLYTVT